MIETPPAANIASITLTVNAAKTLLDIAVNDLTVAGNIAERDLITGSSGASALRHLREAVRAVEKAQTQLASIKR